MVVEKWSSITAWRGDWGIGGRDPSHPKIQSIAINGKRKRNPFLQRISLSMLRLRFVAVVCENVRAQHPDCLPNVTHSAFLYCLQVALLQ